MMDRQKGDFVFECDVCGSVLETYQADFDVARNMLRRQGWTARKVGKDWIHGCAKCGNPAGKELL